MTRRGAGAITLAGAPVSWGVDFAGDPGNPPPDAVLDGIAAAGLRALELGPPGYLPADAGVLAARGLEAAGTFVFAPFHDPQAREHVLAATRDALDWLALLGGDRVVLIDRPSGPRAATAGRSGDAERLDGASWPAMIETLRRAAELVAGAGAQPVAHPHAGSRIEFRDEVERLLGDVPADELGLCLDTGHALYAGDDPCDLARTYAARLAHVHLKDVEPARRRAALAEGRGFWDAIATGVFCPVGDGLLDLGAFAGTLSEIGYRGYAVIEQDRRAGAPGAPQDDLEKAVAALRAHGFGTG